MPEAHEGTLGSGQMSDRVIEALDEATVISDILTLLFWAGEGMAGAQGAAVARGAVMAQERLSALKAKLKATPDRKRGRSMGPVNTLDFSS